MVDIGIINSQKLNIAPLNLNKMILKQLLYIIYKYLSRGMDLNQRGIILSGFWCKFIIIRRMVHGLFHHLNGISMLKYSYNKVITNL